MRTPGETKRRSGEAERQREGGESECGAYTTRMHSDPG